MSKRPARPVSQAARRRSAARLAAVQALYQTDLGGASADDVLRDFLDHRIAVTAPQALEEDGREADMPLVEPDSELLTGLVRGTLERRADLDGMIAAALSREWTMERLESVLRAILRAGACELLARPDIPPRVTISEYVDVAHAFYSGPEPGLVNAVLDRIARALRAEELDRDDPAS